MYPNGKPYNLRNAGHNYRAQGFAKNVILLVFLGHYFDASIAFVSTDGRFSPFFFRSVDFSFREKNQSLPHQTTFVHFIMEEHQSTLLEAYSLLRSRSRRAIERVGRVERRDRSIIRTYVHTYSTDRSYYDRVCTPFGTHGWSVVDLAPRQAKQRGGIIKLCYDTQNARRAPTPSRRDAISAVAAATVCVHPIYMPFSRKPVKTL